MPTLVSLVRQAYEYSCGAAALASCRREPELYPLLNTDEDGTSG
jgi:predicted double-glycine peptidase